MGRERREARRPGYGKVSLLPHHMAPSSQRRRGAYRQGGALTRRLRQFTFILAIVVDRKADSGPRRLLRLTGRSGRFGLSWRLTLWSRKPRFWGLEKLGFPWILSSETSLFNGLRGIFAEKNFSRPLARRGGSGGMGAGGLGVRKGRIAHGTSLALFLIFCNAIVATAVLVRRSRPQQGAAGRTAPKERPLSRRERGYRGHMGISSPHFSDRGRVADWLTGMCAAFV